MGICLSPAPSPQPPAVSARSLLALSSHFARLALPSRTHRLHAPPPLTALAGAGDPQAAVQYAPPPCAASTHSLLCQPPFTAFIRSALPDPTIHSPQTQPFTPAIHPPQAIIKPQYVDQIPKAVKGKVGELLQKKDDRGVLQDNPVE